MVTYTITLVTLVDTKVFELSLTAVTLVDKKRFRIVKTSNWRQAPEVAEQRSIFLSELL